jgi:hypothetical protein
MSSVTETTSGTSGVQANERRFRVPHLELLLLLIPVIATSASFWPGRMSSDSLVMIAQVSKGIFDQHYAPILEAMWYPFFHVGFGPAWILTGQVLTFSLGAFFLLRLAVRPLPAALAVVAIAMSPMLFGWLGAIERDVWFMAFLTCCFAAVGHSLRASGRRRRMLIIGAVVLAWLTIAARQNAGAAMFVPLATLAGSWLLARRPTWLKHRIRLSVASCVIGLAATLAMMASQDLLFKTLPATPPFSALAPTYIEDLAALSVHDGRNYFPKGMLPKDWRTVLADRWNPNLMDELIIGPTAPIAWPASPAEVARLRQAWEHRIIHEPLTYLRTRATVMADETALTEPAIGAYFPFVDPNRFGFTTRFKSINRVATNYMSLFTTANRSGDFLFSVWFYVIICLIAATRLLKRELSLRSLVFGLLGLASVTYQVGMFFGIPGTDYLYEIAFVATGLMIGIVGLAWFWSERAMPVARQFRTKRGSVPA